MRIAFVCGFAWEPKGTVRTRAFPLAVELVERGHEVTMFLAPYDNPLESGKQHTLEGVRIVNVEVSGEHNLVDAPLIVTRLCRAIERYSPDLVHIFKPKGYAGAVCTWLVAKNKRPVALDADDWEGWGGWNDSKNYLWVVKQYIDWQERWLTRRAPVVTVASRALETRAVKLRGSAKGVFYIPNGGVSREDALAREQMIVSDATIGKRSFELPPGPVIFYSGHFEAGDGTLFFCRAASPVARRTGATIVFVGEGPNLSEVRSFFESETDISIRFFPRLPYREFIRLVSVSDVAAFPYPDNPVHQSKCSVRITDYMSVGKAVLTTAVGQNLDYIVPGESGILTEPGNEAQFGAELERLLSDPELRKRLGESARKRMREKFAWGHDPVEHCLTAYRQLLGL